MSVFSLELLHVHCYPDNIISYLAVVFCFYQIRVGQTNKKENKQENRKKRIDVNQSKNIKYLLKY